MLYKINILLLLLLVSKFFVYYILQEYTLEELRKYDGTDKESTILLAIDGRVFDVTKAREIYGPGNYGNRTSH